MRKGCASPSSLWMPHLLMLEYTLTRLSITHWWLHLYPPSTPYHLHYCTAWYSFTFTSTWIQEADVSFLFCICVWGDPTHSWSLENSAQQKPVSMVGESFGVLRLVSSSVSRSWIQHLMSWQCGVVSLVSFPWQRILQISFLQALFLIRQMERSNTQLVTLRHTPYPLCVFISHAFPLTQFVCVFWKCRCLLGLGVHILAICQENSSFLI